MLTGNEAMEICLAGRAAVSVVHPNRTILAKLFDFNELANSDLKRKVPLADRAAL